MHFFLREAWHELRAGLKGGVLPLIYVVLTAYILLVMTSADNLRSMGAVDIPRNAPALVYLMTAGDAFFLFFAWAWVFAQPIVRDRQAQLHEVVLAAPVSLRTLLAARYLGALGVALLLGTSQILGFLAAPLLEMAGALPPGSVAATPWFAFGWAFLIFTLPLAAGAGALYFIAAAKSRSVGGAFAMAAALMAFWMVSMIVFKEGHADPFLVTVLDPSGFAEVEHVVVDHWTPHEKSTALLPLSPALAWNRLLWGLAPLGLLALFIARARRETLLHGRGDKPAVQRLGAIRQAGVAGAALPGPVTHSAWLAAATAEALWQARQILARRSLWLALALLTVLAVAAAFVHGIQHAWGPMVARGEFISPVLLRTFYLIIVFMAAAMVGIAARRDEQPGLVEMFDAAPAPGGVRLAGRATAALVVGMVCAALPAAGAIVVGLLTTPDGALVLPLAYQMAVLLPGVLELAAVVLLLHALIRRPGVAHAASILAAFIMVVNFETGLVNYPPHQIGRGTAVALSGLTGFAPWAEKLLASNAFKLALVALLLALAAIVAKRGADEGWAPRLRQWRHAVLGGPGVAVVAAVLSLAGSSAWLHQRFVTEGGYETRDQELADNAVWEQRWLGRQAAYQTAGGTVTLHVLPAEGALRGEWSLRGVRTSGAELHALLPNGFTLLEALVDGQAVEATVDDEHLAIPLAPCHKHSRDRDCTVDVAWRLSAAGWRTGEHDALAPPPWLVGDAFWIRASEVMPRLGMDSERVVRAPAERQRLGLPAEIALPAWQAAPALHAVAPAGRWQWKVTVEGQADAASTGELHGLLDFAALHAPQARALQMQGVRVLHDAQRDADAQAVAEDLAAMRACVARRLGNAPEVGTVAQWPRGLPTGNGDAALASRVLLIAEAPHWDVASHGTGRLARRADIAAALVRRTVADVANLREGPGHLWLSEGLPGAIGLLCVTESDGEAALQALLARGADRTTAALASAENPVGPLAQATHHEWAPHYAPLAALNWVAGLQAADIGRLLAAVHGGGDLAAALASAGADAATVLGAPRAADLHARLGAPTGERWQWRNGGWQADSSPPQARQWQVEQGGLRIGPAVPGSTQGLLLDDWIAYEREPKDNNPGDRAVTPTPLSSGAHDLSLSTGAKTRP